MATMDYNMGFSENLQNPIIYHHFSYENGWPIWGTSSCSHRRQTSTDHSHPAVDIQDLWIFTAASRQPGVSLPVDLPMGMGPDGGDTAVAEKAMVETCRMSWFSKG